MKSDTTKSIRSHETVKVDNNCLNADIEYTAYTQHECSYKIHWVHTHYP